MAVAMGSPGLFVIPANAGIHKIRGMDYRPKGHVIEKSINGLRGNATLNTIIYVHTGT